VVVVQEQDANKLQTLQQLLGLDADEVRELDAKVDSGSAAAVAAAAEEEDTFF
jgi:hypothetical protein